MTTSFVIVGQRGTVAIDPGFRISIEYRHEPVGLGKWQGTEQHRIDHGKNRQIRTEANSEGQKSGSCKCRGLLEQAGGVTQLPAELVKEVHAKGFPAIRFDVDGVAKLHPYLAGRFFPRHAGPHEVVGVLLNVETQLLGHSIFEITPPSERTKHRTKALEHVTPPLALCSTPRQSLTLAGSSPQFRHVVGGALRRSRCSTS